MLHGIIEKKTMVNLVSPSRVAESTRIYYSWPPYQRFKGSLFLSKCVFRGITTLILTVFAICSTFCGVNLVYTTKISTLSYASFHGMQTCMRRTQMQTYFPSGLLQMISH